MPRDGSATRADFRDGTVRFDVAPGRRDWLGYAPGRTGHWRDYTAAVTVSDLSADGGNGSGALEVLTGSDASLRVTVTGGWARVERIRTATTRLAEVTLPLAADHRIEVLVRPERVVVRIDGDVLWFGDLPRSQSGANDVAGGIALNAHRPTAEATTAGFRDLTVTRNQA